LFCSHNVNSMGAFRILKLVAINMLIEKRMAVAAEPINTKYTIQ
jgi:hypothetical protein